MYMDMRKIINEIINGKSEDKKNLDNMRIYSTYRIKRIKRRNYNSNQLTFIDKLGESECNRLKRGF